MFFLSDFLYDYKLQFCIGFANKDITLFFKCLYVPIKKSKAIEATLENYL